MDNWIREYFVVAEDKDAAKEACVESLEHGLGLMQAKNLGAVKVETGVFKRGLKRPIKTPTPTIYKKAIEEVLAGHIDLQDEIERHVQAAVEKAQAEANAKYGSGEKVTFVKKAKKSDE